MRDSVVCLTETLRITVDEDGLDTGVMSYPTSADTFGLTTVFLYSWLNQVIYVRMVSTTLISPDNVLFSFRFWVFHLDEDVFKLPGRIYIDIGDLEWLSN